VSSVRMLLADFQTPFVRPGPSAPTVWNTVGTSAGAQGVIGFLAGIRVGRRPSCCKFCGARVFHSARDVDLFPVTRAVRAVEAGPVYHLPTFDPGHRPLRCGHLARDGRSRGRGVIWPPLGAYECGSTAHPSCESWPLRAGRRAGNRWPEHRLRSERERARSPPRLAKRDVSGRGDATTVTDAVDTFARLGGSRPSSRRGRCDGCRDRPGDQRRPTGL